MGRHTRRKPMSVEDRLYANEHRPDQASHLTTRDELRCRDCSGRECTRICPAETYQWDDEGRRLVVRFENCLECGACRTACPHANIEWRYPMGGMGICYRYG